MWGRQQPRVTHLPAPAAPRTSIDLTSLVPPFYPSLFYFPILTLAAAAPAHFLPSLIDVPSVDGRLAFLSGSICVGEDVVVEKEGSKCTHSSIVPPPVLVFLWLRLCVSSPTPDTL